MDSCHSLHSVLAVLVGIVKYPYHLVGAHLVYEIHALQILLSQVQEPS